MCRKCNTPYLTKWGECPDCKPETKINYKHVNDMILIPARYRNAYEGEFSSSEAKMMIDFADDKIDGVFLHGSTGTGKTFLATALMQEHCKHTALGGRWITAGMILQEIRSTYGSKPKKTESEVMVELSTCPLLLIDDLGAEKVTDWSISTLYEIISDRINWCRPIIVTSNLGIPELSKWNPRIASRLGAFVVIEMAGKDRRIN